ncbi:Unconventional myosin-Vb [Larimichthys crocea]|uniref:Uncharacterized protein n=1 Tax=Larimichthys crocea TaxID=215358 RepID=A0ACD3RM06_LARCR|nr:Unconventional myosin-Vb [Larimichthys crocea]
MKAALKKHSNDVDMTAMWLKNACLLHDLLTQHSPKQTLNSDELVPLTTDVSDLIRTLSDLCIQAYQQLLSITEKRLQNIIGTPTKKTMLMLLILSTPPLLSSHLVLSFSLSPCSVRERDHPRVCLPLR